MAKAKTIARETGMKRILVFLRFRGAVAGGGRKKHAAFEFASERTLQTHGLDIHNRTNADVILPEGMDLNQDVVKLG